MEHALREEGRSRPSRTGPAAPVPPLIVGPSARASGLPT